MASCSHNTYRASSNAPECNEQVSTMERHSNKLLRPRSLIRDLKVEPHFEKLSRLPRSLIYELRDVSDELKMSKSLEEDARDVISDDPEEQLLQAIRCGATAGEVESYLNLTFQKISPGVDEEIHAFAHASTYGVDEEINEELASASLDEQRNEGDKKRALARARARVYDKALGEAKDGTPIEEFLLKKLQTDKCLQRGGEHCTMVDCSAARWNMVNIVLALIRWRGAAEFGRSLRKEELLAVAVEYGHVELVQHLTKMNDVNVNRSSYENFYSDIPNNAKFTEQTSNVPDFHFPFLEPIGSAARMGNVDMVMSLLACDRIDVNKGKPLHSAAATGHLDVVEMLLQSKKQVDVNTLTWLPLAFEDLKARQYSLHFSPLHFASLFGHTSVVKALCKDTKGRLRANTENRRGITALQIATEMKYDEIVKTLLERPEVAKQVENLYRDRQVHVDAANAILVGAALIASVTFAGWLQPPLGYSAFFGSAEVGAPSPSGIYPSFVSVAGHPIMQIFLFFNSMSFFFAIATLMVGASAAHPPKHGIFIGEVVQSLRASLSLAYILLTISVGCVMGAFASAGFLVLPPIPKYMLNMRVTVGIGVTVVFLAWTSSKLLYVLKVMKKIVTNIIDQILVTEIMIKILNGTNRRKPVSFF
jgi:ankyrin repeat protein